MIAAAGSVRSVAVDLERARRDTPAAERIVHLNNAGAALPPRQVTEAAVEHLRLEARMGGYEAAEAAAEKVDRTYTAVAELIGSGLDEVAIVENATRAWDMAFYALRFSPGDRILTSRAEYASNVIAFLQVARKTGVVVEVVDDDESGQISVEDLRGRIVDQTNGPARLIALTHIPTQGGLVNPAKEVGAVAREAGVTYILDACQSIGQMPVRVEEVGCDILSATGRKYLRGPRGAGLLYVRRGLIETLEPPFLDLHAATWVAPDRYEIRRDARRFENWEANYAAKIALGVAVEYALSWGLESIAERVAMLGEALRDRLREVPGVRVHDLGTRRCGIVTFSVDGVAPAEVQRELSRAGVNTSVSLAEYAQFDLAHRGLSSVVRASAHYYNTEEELDRLVQALPRPRAT